MDKTNPIDHPRTYAALMEASDADGAHEVCELCAKLEEENARLKIEQTYYDTLIMSVHYYCGGFTDLCPDDEFGNRMLEWLLEQRKRIMDSDSASADA